MTYDEYLKQDHAEHLAVVEWWFPTTLRPYAKAVRYTYYLTLTPWADHPWSSRYDPSGSAFEDEWAVEAGEDFHHLSPSGRIAGWGALKQFKTRGHETRLSALGCARESLARKAAFHDRESRLQRNEMLWIATAIRGEHIDTP